MIILRYDLHNAGADYVSDELGKGSSYAQSLLALVEGQRDHVYTYLPPELETARLDFRDAFLARAASVGLAADTVESELEREVFHTVLSLASAISDSILVLETLRRPGYPPTLQEEQPYFTYRDEVYLYLRRESLTMTALSACVRKARSYPLIVGVTSFGRRSFDVQPGVSLSTTDLDSLAQRTQLLMIGAYDDESYVIWSKESDVF